MNITLDTRGITTNYCGAKLLSVEKGREIFFCGKDNSNAVEISLNNEHVEIEIKIKDKKKV